MLGVRGLQGRPARGAGLAAAAATAVALGAAPAARAVPDCASMPKPKVLLDGQGRLESVAADARRGLYFSDLNGDRLLRLARPGAQSKVVAEDVKRPGGLVFEPDGTLVAGFSGGPFSGVPGNGMAGILRVDPDSGAKHGFVSGIDQANGLARTQDGTLYTSNDIDDEIVRVRPGGQVDRHWVDVTSANGLAIDTAERYLFVAQTFTPAKIARVPLARPEDATTFFAAPSEDTTAGLDGMTRDGANRLYVAANGGGEVWRVDADGRHGCALVRGLTLPSSVGFGAGGAFAARNLYVVTFRGNLIELPRVTNRPPLPPGSRPPAAERGKLVGRVVRALGPRHRRRQRAIHGHAIVTLRRAGRVVARRRTRSRGKFTFRPAPGTYRVAARARRLRCRSRRVRVRGRALYRVHVVCRRARR